MHRPPATRHTDRPLRPNVRRLSATAVAVVLAGTGMAACDDDEDAAQDDVSLEELQRLENRIERLELDLGFFYDRLEEREGEGIGDLEEPELLGQAVTINGEVTSVIDDHGFVLGGDEELDPTEASPSETGILVVTAEARDISPGDVVQVVGVVQRYDTATFQEQLGIELDGSVYDAFGGEVALRADSIATDVPEDQ